MTQITLTANQKTGTERQVQSTEQEQVRTVARQAQLTECQTLRDAKYEELRVLLVELGHTPPDPITEVHRELDANEVWTSGNAPWKVWA